MIDDKITHTIHVWYMKITHIYPIKIKHSCGQNMQNTMRQKWIPSWVPLKNRVGAEPEKILQVRFPVASFEKLLFGQILKKEEWENMKKNLFGIYWNLII